MKPKEALSLIGLGMILGIAFCSGVQKIQTNRKNPKPKKVKSND